MKRGSSKNRMMDAWVGIPVLNFLATFSKHRQWPEKIERIGLICSPALGDTLLFSAVVADVRAHFRNACLVLFCTRQNIAAAMLIPAIDKHIVVEMTNPRTTVRELRAQNLDLLIDCSAWQRLTAFYCLLSGASFTAGFRTGGQFRDRGYDLTAVHRNDRHELENYRSLIRVMGITAELPPTIEPLAAPCPEVLSRGKELIVFHAWPSGANSSFREWPDDRWVELGVRLAGENTLFLITGSPTDLPNSERLSERLRSSGLCAEPFVGGDGFNMLCQLLLNCKMVVSVNTGVMHLAAILGAPTFSLNGPTNNERWGPVGPKAIGIQSKGKGCGYLNLGFEFKNKPTDCMARISVDDVMLTITESLSLMR